MGVWDAFKLEEFEFEGRRASIVMPNGERNGKWLLKTEYRDAFPEFEIEMVKRGWCVAFNDNISRWSTSVDLERKAKFCQYITETYGLEKTCVPVGMSCGGQYAVLFAAKYPELVSCLYIDAPVMNYLSCPAKIGVASTEIRYEEYYKATGITLSELLNYREHPIDFADKLLADKKPIIMVYGDADPVVPYVENGAILEKKYKEQGGIIETYGKPGCAHHPHGLEDPTPIINFVEKYA